MLLGACLVAVQPDALTSRPRPEDVCALVTDGGVDGELGVRLRVTCEMRLAFEQRYVDPDSARPAFDDAVLDEAHRADDLDAFEDRTRERLAALHDGHIRIDSTIPEKQTRAWVLPLLLAPSSRGRFIATATGDERVPLGAEIVSVDAQNVASLVDDRARRVPSSSDGARMARAARWALVVAFGAATKGAPLSVRFRHHGAERTASVDRVEYASAPPLDWTAYSDVAPLLPVDVDRVKRSEDALGASLRLGTLAWGGQTYAYAQLLEFELPRSLRTKLGDLVATANAKGWPVVLDLRANGGGSLRDAYELFSLLSPGVDTPGGVRVRASPTVLAMLTGAPDPAHDSASVRELAASQARAVEGALASGARTTDLVRIAARAKPPDAGLHQKLVVLITPSCASTCDVFATLLRERGRAVFVGAPTEGAANGYSYVREADLRWRDSRGLFELVIPNHTVYVLDRVEGRPVLPDVEHELDEADVDYDNLGWRTAIQVALQR